MTDVVNANTVETPGAIWVSEVMDRANETLPLGLTITTFFTVNMIPIILNVLFFYSINSAPTKDFAISQALITVMILIGPFAIKYYDNSVFPDFLNQIEPIVKEKEKLTDISNKYMIFFRQKYWIMSIIWSTLLVSVVVANINYFEQYGIVDIMNVSFLIYLLFVCWIGVISSIGFHMIVTTILCIREIGNLKLQVDPLHPDQLGGLSNIGILAIRTTMLNSIGALGLPLAFTFASSGNYESLVYFVVVIYTLFVLFSFLYPTVYVNRKAETVREKEIQNRREKIHDIRQNAIGEFKNNDPENVNIEHQLQIRLIRDELREYQNVKLYPFTVSILTRLVSSVLLPVVFMLLETFVISA